MTDALLSELTKVVRHWKLRSLRFIDCDLTAVSKDKLVKFVKRCSPSLEVLCFRCVTLLQFGLIYAFIHHFYIHYLISFSCKIDLFES